MSEALRRSLREEYFSNASGHHDGNRVAHLPHLEHSARPGHHDHVHVKPQQLPGERDVTIELSPRRPCLDDDVLPVDPAKLPEPVQKGSQVATGGPGAFELRGRGVGEDEGDPGRSLPGSLGLDNAWSSEEAAAQAAKKRSTVHGASLPVIGESLAQEGPLAEIWRYYSPVMESRDAIIR